MAKQAARVSARGRVSIPVDQEPAVARGGLVVEQLLKDWIAERTAAADLSVAARSVKSIASEIETHYADQLTRSRSEIRDRDQVLAEREHSLEKAIDVVSRLEGQLAQLRDRCDRIAAAKDDMAVDKEAASRTSLAVVEKLEAQFGSARQRLEERVDKLEAKLSGKSDALTDHIKRLAHLEKDVDERDRLLESYRQKFGVIMKAVR